MIPSKLDPQLSGVPETMLWTLHNRASEAKKRRGLLRDPEAVRIYEAINYDYVRHFGRAEGSHAVRAVAMDRVLRGWLDTHPRGMVVSLGEGLETQVTRLDNGRLRWLSVDLPEAIALRARFLPPTDRFRHFTGSALDRAWMDLADPANGLFIVAQGLFMYLPESEIRNLLGDIADRFPDSEIVFDTIPRWISRLTLRGLKRTRHYLLPPMPWGIDRHEIEPTLRNWDVATKVTARHYRLPYGTPGIVDRLLGTLPRLHNKRQCIVHARLGRRVA